MINNETPRESTYSGRRGDGSFSNPADNIEISATSTSCLHCAFATFNDKTQIGCMAEQLDKFRKNNIEVLEVFNEDGDEFFMIKDKICCYHRPKEMVEQVLDKTTHEEILQSIKKRLIISYQAIVFFRTEDSVEDLNDRLAELQSQKTKPNVVTIIDRSHSVDPREGRIIKLLNNDYSFNYWRVQTASAIDQEDNDLIDLCYDNTKTYKYFFYIAFEASKTIPLEFSEEMHESIQNKMMSFTILTPNKDGIGGGALKAAHAKYAGNSFGIPLEKKIRHYDDSVHLIKKVEELCPSLHMS